MMVGRRAIPIRRQVKYARVGWALEERRRARLRSNRARSARVRVVQYDRANSAPPDGGQWASHEYIEQLNRSLGFEPLSETDARRLEDAARAESSDSVLDRKVCAVTDVWIFRRQAVRVKLCELPLRAMRMVLRGGDWCTQAIIDYYDCSTISEDLRGLLLSRRAFEQDEDGTKYLWVSAAALEELKALETRLSHTSGSAKDAKPPKFAIADGFVAGAYNEIDDATCVERQAIGLVQIRGIVKVVYGGPGNTLNSHLLCWDNRHATIASRVPSVVTRENFQLILAGPMTPAQELLVAKRHECSGDRVRRMHNCLCRVNPLYADLVIDSEVLASLNECSSVITRVDGDAETEQLIEHARARQATVARPEDTQNQDANRECTVIESQTVLMETVTDQNEQDRLAHAYANVVPSSHVYVARRSTSILQATDPHYAERLFPHLFTFGIGGFSTARSHRYSARAVVLHYLNLSTNRFAEDPMFKLVMFDHISTQRVKSGVFLRVGQDPSIATTAMRVTPEQLKAAMQNRSDQRAAWRSGRSYAPSESAPSAAALLKSIHAAASKMWGSNEERESMSRKVEAMTIRFGAPSIFWTLTPNPDTSLVCAFWTGKILSPERPDTLSKCGELHMPACSQMTRMIMTNTVVQAQYYKICCYLLVDILFGWDTKANKPKSQRGIFGFVEALVYALEQQGRLFVHRHGVAWIAGLPKTQSDWDRLLASDHIRKKFECYCASIFSSELPVYESIQNVNCPQDGCSGQLVPSPIHKKFKHILKPSVPAPIVAKCDICGKEFTESQIVLSVIDDQWNSLDEANKNASSSSAVEAIRHKFAGISRHNATAKVQLSRLLLRDQVHSTTHSRSCIKGRAGTKCRYNFFRDLVPATGLNKDDEMVYRRRVGNQWLNPFVPLWRRILHFNMDARVLWSRQGLQATRYALQYAVKRQTVLDNVGIVDIAFKRRVSREMDLQTTKYAQGIGRLMSLAYSTSGVMEIGGPLATTILQEGEAVTFSCTFERLVLIEGLNILNNENVQASIVERNHVMFAETSISRYIERPACLEQLCWYDYCSWLCRIGTASGRSGERCTFTSDNTELLRQHLKAHKYRYLDSPRVPEIIGPRLPDGSRLGNEEYEEQTELYHRMALLLYHPFRDPTTFLDNEHSARAFYHQWDPLSKHTTSRALELHQQHYICLQKAQQYRQQQRQAADEDSDADEVCIDEDVIQPRMTENRDTRDARVEYETVRPEYYSVDNDVDMEKDNSGECANGNTSPVSQLLHQSIVSITLPEDASFELTVSPTPITRSQVRKFNSLSIDENATQDDTTTDWLHPDQTTEILVDRFHDAVRDLTYDQKCLPAIQLPHYASIREVSAWYRLNYLQHIAFALIAVPLLGKITGCSVPIETGKLFDETPVIVTGAGGTGKSQIIAAVRALAQAWDRPNAVAVVASTGIAAASLQGSTMHSSVGLGVNATSVPDHISSPTDTLIQQWSPVMCVIADEVSMTDLGFFGLWEESLRHAKDNKNQAFGGLLAVLLFDHCQLRTVKGLPLFATTNGTTPLTSPQNQGCLLYQSVTKVVYLTENMRFTADPEWGCWLAQARLGDWTSDCQAYVASLHDSAPREQAILNRPLQTISTDNNTRSVVNEAAVKLSVDSFGLERKVYGIPALLSRRASPTEIAFLRQQPDNKTGHIPLFLTIYVGMPVRIKANQCVSKGVANGATAIVYHIDWQRDTTFSQQPDGTWLASAQPNNIYVDILNAAPSPPFPSLPPHWPTSVMPIHKASSSLKVLGSSISIKGYPIVPAFGTTVHGVQGETLDAVAITSLRPPHVRKVDKHAMYVALSRVRTRYGLYWVGTLPTANDYAFFRPDTDVLLEDNRLKRLSNATVSKFVCMTF